MATAEELTQLLEERRARLPVSEGESLSLRSKQKEKTEQVGTCSALALRMGLLGLLQGCEGVPRMYPPINPLNRGIIHLAAGHLFVR